jgi:threonine synthase
MQYFSTNRKSPTVSFREAVLNGQPDDKGLYFPAVVPQFPAHLLGNLADLSEAEVAFAVIKPYIGNSIPDEKLFEICRETVDSPFPLVEISDKISALELFHGPTLAFKDIGARFMSHCLRHFSAENSQKTVVIVATSGDTGGAVANGFHNNEGIEVVILYPKSKVSRVQELQLTTLGGNVITLEVQGTFDDCQFLAKQALSDADLREKVILTSANSINVARWLPQQFYYLFALKQWDGPSPIISVPSGNFGNLAAGMLANRSGLPIERFIAACNANDVVPEFFKTGNYIPKPSVSTLSNAMDVGDPSNFVRILEMFDEAVLRQTLEAISISDDRTAETMRRVHHDYGYILDPHGAVAYAALVDHLENHRDSRGFILETAHPIKFDSVESIIGNHIVMPESVKKLEARTKHSIEIDASYEKVKEVVLSRI